MVGKKLNEGDGKENGNDARCGAGLIFEHSSRRGLIRDEGDQCREENEERPDLDPGVIPEQLEELAVAGRPARPTTGQAFALELETFEGVKHKNVPRPWKRGVSGVAAEVG